MCALCAALAGERYWTDAAGSPEFAADGTLLTRKAERLRRLKIINRVLAFYGLAAADWGGSVYMITNNAGREGLADHLNGIWAAARSLRGSACDPLDPHLLNTLERAGSNG